MMIFINYIYHYQYSTQYFNLYQIIRNINIWSLICCRCLYSPEKPTLYTKYTGATSRKTRIWFNSWYGGHCQVCCVMFLIRFLVGLGVGMVVGMVVGMYISVLYVVFWPCFVVGLLCYVGNLLVLLLIGCVWYLLCLLSILMLILLYLGYLGHFQFNSIVLLLFASFPLMLPFNWLLCYVRDLLVLVLICYV